MRLDQIMSLTELISMQDQGYVREQAHPLLPHYRILNYTEKAQYEQKWNKVTLSCRGLIYRFDSLEVIARPFEKFFNWDDSSQAYPPESQCILMPKMDGSLGILYHSPLGWEIATRGSFSSDQARKATEMFRSKMTEEWFVHPRFDKTYLFEIIYPENQIVVDYGGKERLVLLDVIDNETGKSDLSEFNEYWWEDKVDRKTVKFTDSLVHEIPKGEEGFVMLWYYQNHRVKMKSAEYLEIHKLVFGLNARVVWSRISRGETWQEICEKIPDEFHAWVKNISDDLHKQFRVKKLAAEMEYRQIMKTLDRKSDYREDRKAFARKTHGSPNSGLLFMLYDQQDISQKIWDSLKPSGADSIKIISEDVA